MQGVQGWSAEAFEEVDPWHKFNIYVYVCVCVCLCVISAGGEGVVSGRVGRGGCVAWPSAR